VRRFAISSLAALSLAPLGAASCEPPGDGSADAGTGLVECFFGDEGQDPVGELVFLDEDFQLQDLAPGQAVPLILPPQGGKVVFIGARLKNMDLCSLQANGGVFDDCPTSPRIIGREGRGIQMVENAATGFAEPADPTTINNYVNLPLCGNFTSSRDIDGEPYRVEIRFSDRARRSLVLTADITPFCPGEPGAEDGQFEQCTCECDADFGFDGACEDIIVDDDRPAGTCPAANDGDPLPVCTPACDAARVCAETATPGVGECR
jgi:hypothetical protein